MTSVYRARALNLLVADDDVFVRGLIIDLLQGLGHSGVAVDNGKKALDCLAKRAFDAVLLDVMMPVMDGLETLAAIRAHEASHGGHLPIIMVTGHAEPGDEAKLKRAGADGYVTKPINGASVKNELTRVLTFAQPVG